MKIRKHIAVENYKSFTQRFYSLVENLSDEEQMLLEKTPRQFAKVYPGTRLFPDPFLPSPPQQQYFLKDAAIVTGADSDTQRAAQQLQVSILQKHGVQIPIKDHSDVISGDVPLILIGASHQNSSTLELHKALQMSAFDRHFPGPEGWAVTTFQGILRQTVPRYEIVCSAANCDAAVDYFVRNGVEDNAHKNLNWLHHVEIDSSLPPEYHDFYLWLGQLKHTLEPITNNWLDSDHSQPYHELFLEVLSPNDTEPLIYNAALLDIGLSAIRYYQMTGNERGLDLFLDMMRGCLEYHTSEGANIYISDLDFRLGQICSYWSWIENHPKINTDQRRQFSQLMLGMMRIAHGYYMNLWANHEMSEQGVLHNHQTFPARTLSYGWRYFSQIGVADAEVWKRDADTLFEKLDQSRIKYSENSGSYESMVPHHALDWHELTQRTVSKEFQGTLASFAMRGWVMCDNFFNRVEYGDCVATFAKRTSLQLGIWLEGDNPLFQQIRALEAATSESFPPQIAPVIVTFDAPAPGDPNTDISNITTGWSRLALEQKLAISCELLGTPDERFDKLAWKSAWADDGAYVAVEGFGNKTVSHAHNAGNSVLRANFGGRVWLVGNGYGKKRNIIGAEEAFSSRELGPIDHNMLVICDTEGEQILTPMNAVLLDYGETPLPFSVTRLDDYGGCDWTRHLFVVGNIGLISIDKVTARKGCSLPDKFSLDWNILGEVEPTSFGALSNQKGVQLHFDHFGTASAEWGFNASESWHDVLTNNQYPFTSAPLQKCMLHHLPATNASKGIAIFVSGFWIKDAIRNAIWNAERQRLTFETAKHFLKSGDYSAGWGEIEIDDSSVMIEIKK